MGPVKIDVQRCTFAAIAGAIRTESPHRSRFERTATAEYETHAGNWRGFVLEPWVESLSAKTQPRRGMLSDTHSSERTERSATTDRSSRSRLRNHSRTSFTRDDRAIEGLPIRLVIALVVGVAALALMLNMLGGIGDVGDTEVTVEVNDEDQIIEAGVDGSDGSGDDEVLVDVIDENGNNVEDATVIATAGDAQLDGVVAADTGDDDDAQGHSGIDDHQAVLKFDGNQSLRADQDIGTLELEVVPPSDSNYIDEQPNPEIRVES